jgi:HD-like signal output (HDOD) protein
MSDLLVQYLDADYPEGAFIGGLLHDIGHMLVAWSLPAEYTEIERLCAAGGPRDLCERAVLGFTHEELSSSALAVWKLPEQVQAAVGRHHGPHRADVIDLPRIIDAADRYAKSAGFALHPAQIPVPDKAALLALAIPEELAMALVASFEIECKAVMQFLV